MTLELNRKLVENILKRGLSILGCVYDDLN